MTLFLIAAGSFFWDDFTPGQPVEMRHTFECMLWLLVVIIPMLGMGLLAQEWASGTIETMMTAPVNETEVVLGKFLGSLAFFVVLTRSDDSLCAAAAHLRPAGHRADSQRISRVDSVGGVVHLGDADVQLDDHDPGCRGGAVGDRALPADRPALGGEDSSA